VDRRSAIWANAKIVLWITSDLPNVRYSPIGLLGMEADMRTSTSSVSSQAHRASHWGQLNHVLSEWWQHLRSRHELESLDDSMLRDIGLSRGEAGFEASKHLTSG
jgi:uncharacterized protein YjiS (DUF1127 family)